LPKGEVDTDEDNHPAADLVDSHRLTEKDNSRGNPDHGDLSEDLPVGMMLIGKKWDEETILRAAHAFEQTGAYTGEIRAKTSR